MTNTHPLSGKVVVITGASSGIGAAMARALVQLNCDCKLVLAARSVDKLNALASELGPNALAIYADMSNGADIKTMVDAAVAKFGRIDVMFANAGIYVPGNFAEGDVDAYSQLLTVNIDGVLRCIHAALPHMLAQKSGDILVTSSISGLIDIHWEPVYSASKHAVQSFVHSLRRQVAAQGIRVMALSPGRVANELWGIHDSAEVQRHVDERMSLTNEDVVQAAIFMLSQPMNVTVRDLVMVPAAQDL